MRDKQKVKLSKQRYYQRHREEIRKKQKEYYEKNKEVILEHNRKYAEKNKEKLSVKDKLRRQQNLDKKKEYDRLRYLEQREKKIQQTHDYSHSLALYQPWITRLLVYYDNNLIRRDPSDLNLLQIRCMYCGKWTNPTNKALNRRCGSIRGTETGDCHIYCSDACKHTCPIFRQVLYPRGFKLATSREVQPQLRKLVLKRDNWTCQKCGKSKEENPWNSIVITSTPW